MPKFALGQRLLLIVANLSMRQCVKYEYLGRYPRKLMKTY